MELIARNRMTRKNPPTKTPEANCPPQNTSHVTQVTKNHNANSNDFEDEYELDKKIGKGAYGSVHIARSRARGDEFAVKVIDRSKLKGKDNQVFYEVQALRELSSHPNVVSLIDFFVSPKFFNVVLELARGGDLFDKLSQRKFYTERDARYVAKDILTAISYIHSKNLVHRDLKPENLLLAGDTAASHVVKVADFGFVKNMSDAPTPAGLVTRCGTPSYVAPELVKSIPYGNPVDVWGCGVILYLLLGGYLPFQGRDSRQIFSKILAADFVFHEKYWDPISIEAKQLITRMLTIDPKVRIKAGEALNSSWMAISDSHESISSTNLESTIEGLRTFKAKRKLKAAIHMASIVTKLGSWNAGKLSFMPDSTTSSKSKSLERGKIGQKFDDIYSLQSEIIEGGQSTVWKGLEKETNKTFAIKVIRRKNSAADDASVLSEVAILQSLTHKYVVKIHNYFEESSRFIMVMEFMIGGDVFNRITKNSFYTEKDARELSKSLLVAIEYIHSCGIAHRDLKPQNLLLETLSCNCCVKVTDFGYARRVHAPLSLTTRCGTPTYVAPEILKNHPHDESADMWSVGIIIYVLLAGYPPFTEDRQRVLFQKIRQGDYAFPIEDWGNISDQAKEMIRSLLVVDPVHRNSAEKALQHDWFCGTNERILLNTCLSGSKRHLMKSLERISSSSSSDSSPWVAYSPLPL